MLSVSKGLGSANQGKIFVLPPKVHPVPLVGINDLNFWQDILKFIFEDRKSNCLLGSIIFISIDAQGQKLCYNKPKTCEREQQQKLEII